MPAKNEKLRKEVSKWMEERVKNCHDPTKLAWLATANFRLDYEPAWIFREAKRLVGNQ